MNEVYIVTAGYDREGDCVIGVFAEEEDAIDFQLDTQDTEDYDFVRIQTHEVM